MGRVFRPYYIHRKTGERVTVPSWYAEWTDAAGKTRRKKVGSKQLAQAYLARVQDEAARTRAGFAASPDQSDVRRPLGELLDEYLGVLASRDTSQEYRDGVQDRVGRVLQECGWLLWVDVQPDPMTRFMGGLRTAGRSPATANGYLRDTKGFARWIADRLGVANPLRSVKRLNEQVDRRRSTTILTDAELAALCTAARGCPRSHNTVVDGPSRAVLYEVAAYTGLRASELASLTPERFSLDAAVPVVIVEAKRQKGRRPDPVPLPESLVTVLRKWLRGKPLTEPLWPGRWARDRRQRKWFTRDKQRAGITSSATFHSLRRGYITRLIRAGVDPDLVRRLARHRSLSTTMGHYVHADLADLGDAAAKLKPLPKSKR